MHSETITIRELTPGELPLLWPLIQSANAEMLRETFDQRLQFMQQHGYRCIGAWDGDTLCGACGFWIGVQFWCGPHIELDNLHILADYRRHQIGPQLLEKIEAIGIENTCDMAWLKSYTHNTGAHRFFHRLGYTIRGFVFTKDLRKNS